jgi:hypothetical protein
MTRNFIIHAKTGNGEVVALNAGGSHPQIQFTTEAGQKVSFPQGGLIFGYHPGEQVRVLYTPSDPAKSHTVDAFGALWFVPMLLTLLGSMFILVSWQDLFRRAGKEAGNRSKG